MINCVKPEEAKSLLVFRTCFDSSEVDYNQRSGRIPLSFRTSAVCARDEVLCVYSWPVLWRTTCAEVQWPIPNVGKARDWP